MTLDPPLSPGPGQAQARFRSSARCGAKPGCLAVPALSAASALFSARDFALWPVFPVPRNVLDSKFNSGYVPFKRSSPFLRMFLTIECRFGGGVC